MGKQERVRKDVLSISILLAENITKYDTLCRILAAHRRLSFIRVSGGAEIRFHDHYPCGFRALRFCGVESMEAISCNDIRHSLIKIESNTGYCIDI